MSEFTEKELIQELEKLENDQARIDRISKDIDSGDLRYKDIGAYALAELVGLVFEDWYSWSRSRLVYKSDLGDCGFDHPYAENITYLENEVPEERFLKLSEQAGEIIKKGKEGTDLRTRKKEREIITEKYSKGDGVADLIYAATELETTDGDCLGFSISIGEAGDIEDPITPYDMHFGKDFDFDDYVELDDEW